MAQVLYLVGLFVTVLNLPYGQGGSCWGRVSDNGRCNNHIAGGMTLEECCDLGSGFGWTPEDSYSEGRLFYLQFLGQGARDCTACPRTCEEITCAPSMRCRMRSGVAECVCSPDCSSHSEAERRPVCGSDGKSYRNYCALLRSNCRKASEVEMEYHGRCQYSCGDVLCGSGKSCITDQNGIPHCVACNSNTVCSTPQSSRDNICGGNGETYDSMCHFRLATCLGGQSIGIAYQGACDATLQCSNLTCPDGKKCLTNPHTGRPHCITCGSCHPSLGRNKICATNGRTYRNWCEMQKEGCEKGILLETAHYGECQSTPFHEVEVEME